MPAFFLIDIRSLVSLGLHRSMPCDQKCCKGVSSFLAWNGYKCRISVSVSHAGGQIHPRPRGMGTRRPIISKTSKSFTSIRRHVLTHMLRSRSPRVFRCPSFCAIFGTHFPEPLIQASSVFLLQLIPDCQLASLDGKPRTSV